MTIKRIDHVAIVVSDLDAARAFYEEALGLTVSEVRDVEVEEVRIAFLPVGDSEIELLQPVNETSGVAKYLAKRGEGMHHICIEVEDIERVCERLTARGVRLLSEAPNVGPDGRKYIFAHPKDAFGVLIELYEYPDAF